MLTHLGPFVSYGQQHSCGPDPDVRFSCIICQLGAISSLCNLYLTLSLLLLLKVVINFVPTKSIFRCAVCLTLWL